MLTEVPGTSRGCRSQIRAGCIAPRVARRGLGSNLYSLGVPEKAIQDSLRHANVSTTNTYYIKTAPQQVTEAVAKLEQVFPDSSTGE